MTTQQRVKEIFNAALDCPPNEREQLLVELCAGGDDVRAEVESLLSAHAESDGFLSDSPLDKLAFDRVSALDLTGRRIGVYELQSEIGQGGMATVYLAERMDGEFRQQVALKIVWPGANAEEITRRFKQERQILASLDHPNIARLLDGGTTEKGWPYLVMEYIAGQPITRYCRDRKLPLAERLRLFQSVCAAVAYAHRNLVIHRDIKPSNILVTEDGTVKLPKLLDFGIAKLLAPELAEQQTITGLRPMTPEYASPEQLREETITTATDVYSLGVLLYELLAGAHPFDLKNLPLHELIRIVCEEDPPPPSTLGKETRSDLDNIVLKALNKDPRQRYQTVEQFSDDISRHLDGKTVIARPATLFYRTGKFVRRNKTGVAVVATALLLLLTGLFVTLRQNRQQRYQLYAADMRQAGQDWAEGNLVKMDALLEAHRPGTASDVWRGFEWFALWKLLHTEKFTLRHQASVPTVVFSPDDKILLTGNQDRIEKWDAQTGQALGLFATYASGVNGLRFFYSGSKLIVTNERSRLSIWDYYSRRKLTELSAYLSNYSGGIFFALSPDETKVVTSNHGQPFQLWDTATGQMLKSFTVPDEMGIALPGPAIFTLDGKLLCLLKREKHFVLWDLMASRSVVQLDPQSDDPRASLPFSPVGHLFSRDGTRYYLPTMDFHIRIWDFKRGGKPIQILTGHEYYVETPVLSHDGKLLASGSNDRTLRLWDTQTGKLLVTLKNESQTFAPIFSNDDKSLAAVSMRALVTKVWNVQSLLSSPSSIEQVQTLGVSPDGRMLTYSKNAGLQLRNLRTGQNQLTFTNDSFAPCRSDDCARFSADGKLIASAKVFRQGNPGFAVIRESDTGKVLAELGRHTGPVNAIAFSTDGKTIATGGEANGLIKLWNATTGDELATLPGHDWGITSLDFSSYGNRLASSSRDKTVKVWDVTSGKELFTLGSRSSWELKARFSPDGKILATADMGFTIKLWDAASGQLLHTLKGHANSVYAFAFSPDGKRLASGSDDKTIRLWDLQTGMELSALRGHTSEVWHLFFTPDGKTLISSGEDGTRIWQTASVEEVRAHSHVYSAQ